MSSFDVRHLHASRSVVLSPTNETFKVGERGDMDDAFCTYGIILWPTLTC